MQIRQMSLKELDIIYDLVKELRVELSYDEFEDIVYDMRDNYTMIGMLDRGELLAFAGVDVLTSLEHGRHLYIYDFIATGLNEKYKDELFEYLVDYAKMAMCKRVVSPLNILKRDCVKESLYIQTI